MRKPRAPAHGFSFLPELRTQRKHVISFMAGLFVEITTTSKSESPKSETRPFRLYRVHFP